MGARNHGDRPPWGWDYAFSFLSYDDHMARGDKSVTDAVRDGDSARMRVLDSLRRTRFAYTQLWLPTEGAVVVRFALPEPVMMAKAELIGIELRLKAQYGGGFLPFKESRIHHFENHTAWYAAGSPFFCPSDRVLLTLTVLRSRDQWGAAINAERLLVEGELLKAFALHAEPERRALIQKAVYTKWWSPTYPPPLMDMKKYFGARVTLYFAFVSFYARMLLGLAASSIPVSLALRYGSDAVVSATRLLFGMALVFWATYFFEYWKRRNAVLNVKWGLNDFYDDTENDVRPQFEGTMRPGFYCSGGFVSLDDLAASDTRKANEGVVRIGSNTDPDFELEAAVTGLTFHDLPMFPHSSKQAFKRRIYRSAVLTAFFATCVGAATFMILFYKSAIIACFGALGFARFVPGIANGLLISISDPLWRKISTKLTLWENHRTNQGYENSVVIKRFAFQFVSNYISLLYIAFVKPFNSADTCANDSCMGELSTMMTSLVITKATVQQVLEIGVPYVRFRIKKWYEQREATRAASEPSQPLAASFAGALQPDEVAIVEEMTRAPYKTTVDDFGEIVIQHGFLALFGLAFPIAAIVNLVNNLIEVRSDAYKILAVTKRPDADDAADIGTWASILDFISTASIITNAGLLVFTAGALDAVASTPLSQLALFVIFEHSLILIRKAVSSLVSDSPSSTLRLLARQHYIAARCFGVGWTAAFGDSQSLVGTDSEKHD